MKPKFRVGQRVRLTALAKKQGLQGRAKSDRATIVTVSRVLPTYVTIRRDGLKSAEGWHTALLEKVSRSPEKGNQT